MDNLTKKQELILDGIIEEAAELIQAVQKAKRFGLNTEYKGIANWDSVLLESEHINAMIELFTQNSVYHTKDSNHSNLCRIIKKDRFMETTFINKGEAK